MYYTKAEIQEIDGEVTGVASTETVDRHGEKILAKGWDLKEYKKNPVLLAFHDHTKPIGKATRVWLDKASGKAKLMFKGFISDATENSRAMKQLVADGVVNAFSVGFMPIEMEGNTITKAELHEISFVSVGANPDARIVAVKSLKKAGFKDEFIDDFVSKGMEKNLLDDNEDEEKAEDDKVIENLKKQVAELTEMVKVTQDKADIAVKGLKHLAPQRSKQEVVTERLHNSKVIAKAADKLLSGNVSREKAAISAKVIKRSSEKLIRSIKEDL